VANPIFEVGDRVPDWKLESDNEGEISSKRLIGKKYILYFYPKDDTPGCTKQACGFRDELESINASGYTVIGISPDGLESHEDFREKYDLNFPLVSDIDHNVAKSFGVWREKKNYGKTYVGLVRSTFFVDEEGKFEQIHDNVRATGHVARLVKKFIK